MLNSCTRSFSRVSVADPGGGSGGSGTPLTDLTPTTLRLKFLQWQDRVSRSFLMKRVWYFPTKLNARDIQKCNCFWVPSLLMICSPLLAKQCFPRQQRPAFTDWETRGHLYFLSWLTIMAITADNHVFSTSQIQCNWKWNSNGIEAEAEAMEFESGERCFMPLYFQPTQPIIYRPGFWEELILIKIHFNLFYCI